MGWNATKIPSKNFKCGYCGQSIASNVGFGGSNGNIYICHFCGKPTYIEGDNKQYPGSIPGTPVKHIPRVEVESLFNEARSCWSISAYTASVMCCRKLLMNIAVAEGAEEGKTFAEYVGYLDDNNYIPPKGKDWVDEIRKLGNEANHNINMKTPQEAKKILNFTEMLLRFIYELPGVMQNNTEAEDTV